MNMRYTSAQLREFQALPLERKIGLTAARIAEFYNHFDGKVFVSFSGGKDSTVLLHIVRGLFPDVPALFLNTGLEYPEIVDFVKTFPNVDIRRPAKSFKQVIEENGYPVVSKEISQWVEKKRRGYPCAIKRWHECQLVNEGKAEGRMKHNLLRRYLGLTDAPFKISDRCCKIMKKDVSHKYQRETGRHPIIGTMAEESILRKLSWLRTGCNAFNSKEPKSTPMAFWTEQDVLRYIKEMRIPISPIYGEIVEGKDGKLRTTGATRTGCMYCLFGINHEKQPNRIQRLADTHPTIYRYILDKLGFRPVMEYMGVPCEPYEPRQMEFEFKEEQ